MNKESFDPTQQIYLEDYYKNHQLFITPNATFQAIVDKERGISKAFARMFRKIRPCFRMKAIIKNWETKFNELYTEYCNYTSKNSYLETDFDKREQLYNLKENMRIFNKTVLQKKTLPFFKKPTLQKNIQEIEALLNYEVINAAKSLKDSLQEAFSQDLSIEQFQNYIKRTQQTLKELDGISPNEKGENKQVTYLKSLLSQYEFLLSAKSDLNLLDIAKISSQDLEKKIADTNTHFEEFQAEYPQFIKISKDFSSFINRYQMLLLAKKQIEYLNKDAEELPFSFIENSKDILATIKMIVDLEKLTPRDNSSIVLEILLKINLTRYVLIVTEPIEEISEDRLPHFPTNCLKLIFMLTRELGNEGNNPNQPDSLRILSEILNNVKTTLNNKFQGKISPKSFQSIDAVIHFFDRYIAASKEEQQVIIDTWKFLISFNQKNLFSEEPLNEDHLLQEFPPSSIDLLLNLALNHEPKVVDKVLREILMSFLSSTQFTDIVDYEKCFHPLDKSVHYFHEFYKAPKELQELFVEALTFSKILDTEKVSYEQRLKSKDLIKKLQDWKSKLSKDRENLFTTDIGIYLQDILSFASLDENTQPALRSKNIGHKIFKDKRNFYR